MAKVLPFQPQLRKTKGGRRADLNDQYFRSSWEANYARFLNMCKIPWEYETKTYLFEKKTFIFKGKIHRLKGVAYGSRRYICDFYLPRSRELVEIKGYMDSQSKTKLARMARYFPEIKLTVVGKEFFLGVCKKRTCRIISPYYECPHVTGRKNDAQT